MDHLKSLLDESVVIVSLQYASNVTGAIHSLEEVRNII
jgi:selenocysteine lyase/cysteine desulfurase